MKTLIGDGFKPPNVKSLGWQVAELTPLYVKEPICGPKHILSIIIKSNKVGKILH